MIRPRLPAARNQSVAGNTGPVITEGTGFRQTGTTLLASYDGDAGQPVMMTRAQVGPAATER